jgi:hypothetical protein
MTDWRIRLRDADRALGSDVEPETAQRLRRSVIVASRASLPAAGSWSRTFVATAATFALVCVALLTALQSARLTDDVASPGAAGTKAAVTAVTDDAPSDRQQLQFSTPGGTRIIWVFDPGFEVKGTLP